MVIENNALLKGARGSLGGVVFQPWGDKVIVRSKPAKRKVPVWKQSQLQQLTRMNFKDATVYAKAVTRDREKKAYYARKAKAIGVRSAYSAAISDYMRGLTIEAVDTRRYKVQDSRIIQNLKIQDSKFKIQDGGGWSLLKAKNARYEGTGKFFTGQS
jgi:hypothetical protein